MGMAGIGMMFGAASTGLSVYSQLQQGKTAERVAKYNNEVAINEAKQQEYEARNRELETAEAIKRERANQRAAISAMTTRAGASGFSPTSGSNAIMIGEQASRFEVAIDDAARSASMQASSLRSQGQAALWKGQLGLWNAAQQKRANTIGAIATGLQGIGQLASTAKTNNYLGVSYGQG